MNSQISSKASVVDLVRTALHGAGNVEGLISTPLLIIPISEKRWSTFFKQKRAEEVALDFFRNNGFRAERSHLNFERGYHGLLLELGTPPHWSDVGWDNVPLFLQLQKFGTEYLIDQQRKHLQNTLPADLVSNYFKTREDSFAGHGLHWSHFDSFHLSLELASCLSEAEFFALTDAIIDLELYYVLPGAPDLLVWDTAEKLWFLAEVKGPGDQIRESQRKWLRSNWNQIGSHFLFVSLDVGA